jgi:SpoIIAA-like
MIEQLTDLPPGVLGMKVGGKLTERDYRDVITPMVEDAMRESGALRCLVEIDDDFTGLTPSAVDDDVRLGLHMLGVFDAVAIVTNIAWIRNVKAWAGYFVPFPMRAYALGERAAAAAWLAGLPDSAAITATVDERTGVLTAEVTEALAVEDFEKLAAVADPWLREHGELSGVVLHVRGFPGWASLGSLVRHMRFVVGHQGKVARIALVTDAPGAETLASVVAHVVHPQVRAFPFADLTAATAWAAGG